MLHKCWVSQLTSSPCGASTDCLLSQTNGQTNSSEKMPFQLEGDRTKRGLARHRVFAELFGDTIDWTAEAQRLRSQAPADQQGLNKPNVIPVVFQNKARFEAYKKATKEQHRAIDKYLDKQKKEREVTQNSSLTPEQFRE